MTANDVYILSGVRTAIGKHGGGLASVPPYDLAAAVVAESVRRTGSRYALVTMCIGGGRGIAAVFERA